MTLAGLLFSAYVIVGTILAIEYVRALPHELKRNKPALFVLGVSVVAAWPLVVVYILGNRS